MVESVATEDSSLQILNPIKDKIIEYTCKTCSSYESQCKKVFEELESASAIIDILQREALKTTTMESTCDERTTTKEWNTVPSRNNSSKPNKSSIWKPTATNQYIATTNRFTPLHNLQGNNAESNGQQPQEQRKQIGHSLDRNTNETSNQHRKGMKIPTVINGRLIYSDQKSTTRKKERKRSPTETRASHKVKILGNSHFRGIA